MQARLLIPLGVFAALVALLGYGLTRDPDRVPSPLIGKPVPEFTVPRLAQPDARLSPGDLEGRPYLLNVWASWCVPCLEEHPVLMTAAEELDLTVVGLNYKDKRGAAREWLREHGDPFRLSGFDEEGKVGLELGVTGVPETFLVDRSGVIRRKFVGPLSHQQLREEILPRLRRWREDSG